MAISAATRDTRFSPVTLREMEKIDIEISVLSPMKRIATASEFRLGKDGIYIRKGNRAGTFLPQVAEETGWTKEEFLGHCSRDKAGLEWDSWKEQDVELYTYQALIFSEEEFRNAEFKNGK
jgi:AmmeMemoRadiSam system protein A